jgi:hypothetical protein
LAEKIFSNGAEVSGGGGSFLSVDGNRQLALKYAQVVSDSVGGGGGGRMKKETSFAYNIFHGPVGRLQLPQLSCCHRLP